MYWCFHNTKYGLLFTFLIQRYALCFQISNQKAKHTYFNWSKWITATTNSVKSFVNSVSKWTFYADMHVVVNVYLVDWMLFKKEKARGGRIFAVGVIYKPIIKHLEKNVEWGRKTSSFVLNIDLCLFSCHNVKLALMQYSFLHSHIYPNEL